MQDVFGLVDVGVQTNLHQAVQSFDLDLCVLVLELGRNLTQDEIQVCRLHRTVVILEEC